MTLEDIEFAKNPDPRCPLVLLLDCSGSMAGEPIAELNNGLRRLKNELEEDSLAARRVEVCVVTFGANGVQQTDRFRTVQEWQPPHLEAAGPTPMGQAIEVALKLLNERKEAYKAAGIPYYRPWVFLISDGSPTDQ